MNRTLSLGLPKGSLEKSTLELFARAGWRIVASERNYFPDIDDPEIICTLVKAREMAPYVAGGALDAGLTGRDWCVEYDADVVVAEELVYSKTSHRPARWVLAVAGDSPYRVPEDLAGRKIATELVNVARRWFDRRGIPVTVDFSWGATEAKISSGLADAVVEVTETGSTIRAHGLRILGEVMTTNTQLIANPAAWADDFKRTKIRQIALLLKGALRARAKELAPNNADVENYLGLAYYGQKEYDLAIESYKRALTINPGRTNIHNNLGLVYLAQNNYDQALAEFNYCLKDLVYQNKHLPQTNIGLTYKAMGDYDQALAALSRAVEMAPNYANAYKYIGQVHMAKGADDTALDYLVNAARLDDKDPETFMDLGELYARQGKKEEAAQAYSQVAALVPSTPLAMEAQRKARRIMGYP